MGAAAAAGHLGQAIGEAGETRIETREAQRGMRTGGAGAGVLGDSMELAEREARFRAFVEAHRDRAVRVAWRLLGGDGAAAEDVAQEALLKAYRALPRFREESSLDTWFYRILVRQAYSHRRWRGVRERWNRSGGEEEIADPRPVSAPDPTVQRRIAAALETLTRRQREVFVLVHLEGFSVREVSELLGKPLGTLKSHLHRALVAMRRELADLRELVDGGSEG